MAHTGIINVSTVAGKKVTVAKKKEELLRTAHIILRAPLTFVDTQSSELSVSSNKTFLVSFIRTLKFVLSLLPYRTLYLYFCFFVKFVLSFLSYSTLYLYFSWVFFFFCTLKPLMRDHLSFKTTYFKTFQFLFILPCKRIPHQGSSLF